MTTIDAVVQFIINLFLLGCIPFAWWAIVGRKQPDGKNFFQYVGLKKPVLQKSLWVLLIFLAVFWLDFSLDRSMFIDKALMPAAQSISISQDSPIYGMGWSGVLPAFIINMGANGLCEELFFRGFVVKRLAGKLGTNAAIIISAVLFGLMHNMLYIIGGVEISFMYHLIFVFGVPFTGGLLFGYANEKLFNGSILPSVLLHGLGNFYGACQILFLFG